MLKVLAVSGCLLVAGCAAFSPATEVDVAYPLPNGQQLTAHYSSTKDIEAPSFIFERGPDGKVERIVVAAGSSAASPVIEQNRALTESIISGAVQGAIEGLRRAAPVPGASFEVPVLDDLSGRRLRVGAPIAQPASTRDVEHLIWAANR